MKNDLTLVILAAGMGSRFGGLKQVEEIGPNKEFIIDYSIYDAKLAGFNKVVFIIKEENYEIFRETIGKRIEDKIDVSYAFQKLDDIPQGYELPKDRIKPLGTAQAIYSCRNIVSGPFAIINADDFYGRDAFIKAKEYLEKLDNDSNNYGMVTYKTCNTLTENGSVKRGICHINGGYLVDIVESKVEKINDNIVATPLDGKDSFVVDDTSLVSMNLLLFSKTIFKYIEDGFKEFLDNNIDNLDKCEYLIPDVLQDNITNKNITVKILETTSKWYGVTYKEDKEEVVNAIKKMHEENIYPQNLWK